MKRYFIGQTEVSKKEAKNQVRKSKELFDKWYNGEKLTDEELKEIKFVSCYNYKIERRIKAE